MNTEMRVSDGQQSVEILVGHRNLHGFLNIPQGAKGIVVFALRSGRGRFRSRNQYVASVFYQAGIATLLFDLLDEREADDRAKVFDIDLLAQRLKTAAEWVQEQQRTPSLQLGYFGASTGAAAALVAAAEQGADVKAVVSRGGRPDLAGDALPRVQASTLLIVGGDDEPVLKMNQRALARLRCEKKLTIVPGATHLFTEPGALKQVADLASQWFQLHLVTNGRPTFGGDE
jgi:putative phosphoribosyl transferase